MAETRNLFMDSRNCTSLYDDRIRVDAASPLSPKRDRSASNMHRMRAISVAIFIGSVTATL